MKINERVEREYQNYKNKYEFNEEQEFFVKEYVKLKDEYKNTPDEHVKTRKELLSMIFDLSKKLDLKEKDNKQYDMNILFIGDKYQMNGFFDLFELICNDKITKKIKQNVSNVINLKNGINLNFMTYTKDQYDKFRGRKVDMYFNLTGDVEFENTVLKPMLKRFNSCERE